MPKAEWGVKRTCPNCETRFYDLQREPILCPECGATFNMDDHGKVSGMRERRAPVVAADDADPLVDDDALVEDEDEEESVADPLLEEEDEDEEPSGPTLAEEEDDESEAVAFKEPDLIGDDDEVDEDEDEESDDEEELEDLDEKKQGI